METRRSVALLLVCLMVWMTGCEAVKSALTPAMEPYTRLTERDPGKLEEANQALRIAMSMREEDWETVQYFTTMLVPADLLGEMLVDEVTYQDKRVLLQATAWTSVLFDRLGNIIAEPQVVRTTSCTHVVVLFPNRGINDLIGLPWWGLSHDRQHVFLPDGNLFPPIQAENMIADVGRMITQKTFRLPYLAALPKIQRDEKKFKEFTTTTEEGRRELRAFLQDLDRAFPMDYKGEDGKWQAVSQGFHAAAQVTNGSTARKRIATETKLPVSTSLVGTGLALAGGTAISMASGGAALGVYGFIISRQIIKAVRNNARRGFCFDCMYKGRSAHLALNNCWRGYKPVVQDAVTDTFLKGRLP